MLDKLRTTLVETSGLGGTQLQQQVATLAKAVTKQAKPWGAAPEPLHPLGASEQEAIAVQDALQGGLEKVQATTEAVTRLLKQLGQAAAVLQAGAETAHVWTVLQTARQNRWHNGQGHSPLLALPSEVLHTILHKAGKEARLVCFALRRAFSTPGAGIHLLLADPDQLREPRSQATARLDARIARWPYPQGVTKLAAKAPLEQSTCAAIGATFPGLQELSLPGWEDGAHTALPPTIATLVLCNQSLPRGPLFLERVTCGLTSHFTALQSLSIASLPECTMRDVGLAPLTTLTQLSSLTLATRRAHISCAWEAPPDARRGMGLEVWGTLAALPRLARLCLDMPLEYLSDMPEAVAVLRALTHLTLRCSADMVKRDLSRGVPVPVLQVLQLLPVPLASLHLLEHRALTSDHFRHSHENRALVAQAICSLEVCSMVLDDTPSYGHRINGLAPFLPPSLTSLATNATLELTPAAVSTLLPHSLPSISSLDIDVELHKEAQEALQRLGEQLPWLTSLTLRSRERGRPVLVFPGKGRIQAIRKEPPLVASDLSQLSKLQQLSIGGWCLEPFLAPALGTLPALTSLDLDTWGCQAPTLLQLSRLRSLQLDLSSSGKAVERLEVVRHMGGLTELVLRCADDPTVQRGAVMRLLVPPPAGLQRLVLPKGMVAEAMRVLGGYAVDVVGLPTRSTLLGSCTWGSYWGH